MLIKTEYTIIGLKKDPYNLGTMTLNVPVQGTYIEVHLDMDAGTIRCELEVEKDDVDAVKGAILIACREVVSRLKYMIGYHQINENLIATNGFQLSDDGIEWKKDIGGISIRVEGYGAPNHFGSERELLQTLIDEEVPVFTALRYLHKAIGEQQAAYRWISTTIALELAIKEFLIIKEPNLEPLLLELPSPPLTKLYSKILKSYTGQEVPNKKLIQKGIEKRNELLHKPFATVVTDGEAYEYLVDAHGVVMSLYRILYPEKLKAFQRLGVSFS